MRFNRQHMEQQQMRLSFSLPPNLTGVNTARWRLVGVDGHVISGRVAFTVNALTAPSETLVTVEGGPQSSQTTIQVPQLGANDYFIEPVPKLPRHVFRFINYGALLLFIGLIFVEFFIASGALGLAIAKRMIRIASVALAATATLEVMIFAADSTGKTLWDQSDFLVCYSKQHPVRCWRLKPSLVMQLRLFRFVEASRN